MLSPTGIFEKALSERDRLDQLLSRQEAAIRRAFTAFLADVRSEAVLRQVRLALERNDLVGALKLIDSHVVRFASILPTIFVDVGIAETSYLASTLASSLSHIALSFDPSYPEAAAIMRSSRLEFIHDFTQKQRQATRKALRDALATGDGVKVAARAFRDSIGLTAHQQATVRNYRRLLEQQSAQALSRVLRDSRFDSTVERAIESGTPLTKAQIDKMVARYRERLLTFRADTIARTESLRTLNQARHASLKQMIAQTGLDPSRIERFWWDSRDKRVRDTHEAMNGQMVRGMTKKFTSPSGAKLLHPGDPTAPANEVINCRCTVTVRIRRLSEGEK